MAFIEEVEQKAAMENLTVQITENNKRRLEAYAKFRKSESVGLILDRILGKVFSSDTDFGKWMMEHPEATQKSKRKLSKQSLRAA
jgi:hypothetical protein